MVQGTQAAAGVANSSPAGLQFVPSARPELSNYAGWLVTLRTDKPNLVRIWKNADKTDEVLLNQPLSGGGSGKIWIVGTDVIPSPLYLEVLAHEPMGNNEIRLIMDLRPPQGSAPVDGDVVRFTALLTDERCVLTPQCVDLTIFDGQNGPEVRDEEGGGAVTVANLNDTDADGAQDKIDGNGVIETRSPPPVPGRNEVDLMQLFVHKPNPYMGGPVTLTVSDPARVRIWQDSTKLNPVSEYDVGTGVATWNAWVGGDKTMWVEIISKSMAVADVSLELAYNGQTDLVKATGVWAEDTIWEMGDVNWADLEFTTWRTDMDQSLQEYLEFFGGTGKRPPLVHGNLTDILNVMVMRFTVYPNDVAQQLPRVKFDVSRRVESKLWTQLPSDPTPQPWYDVDTDNNGINDAWATFPIPLEEPNDDGEPEIDESPYPTTPDGYLFVMDTPGIVNQTSPPSVRIKGWQYLNFQEFVRVGLKGQRPDMTDFRAWSICSDYVRWHSRVSVEWNTTTFLWQRMATGGDNSIGTEYEALPASP